MQRALGEFVDAYDYARGANPTRSALERAPGELEGGLATAFASGMAAEHALITAVCDAGDHIVLPDDLYGGTFRLVDKILGRLGPSPHDGRPARPRRARAGARAADEADLGRDADEPDAQRDRRARRDRAGR